MAATPSRRKNPIAPEKTPPMPAPCPRQSFWSSPKIAVLAATVIIFAALAAYHNSFSGPFIYDDASATIDNSTIRHLWPIWPVLSPPPAAGVGGRPLLNLSYAFNYAIGGSAVQGYHFLNLAVHIFAGLTLYGLVRRTLLRPVLQVRFGAVAEFLALAVAVLWIVHPLQTEAVTYVSQRAESIMGLFYLLTLYCFVRSVVPGASAFWRVASFISCLLGMTTKEVMVTAPVMVLFYDRTFVAGTFLESWRQRRGFYLGLMSTWLLLGYLMTGLHQRGVGFEAGITWWAYALTECRVIVQYLELAFWPQPLVLDYGRNIVERLTAIIPYVLILAALLSSAGIAWWRRPRLGFAAAWFFLILAPGSSVVPIAAQPMAEHRMYLSLAAIIVLVVLALYSLLGRWSMAVFAVLAVTLGCATFRRNEDYRSDFAIWNDTVAKRPNNAVAHNNLGYALAQLGRTSEAIAQYEQALQLQPDYFEALSNLGAILTQTGQFARAIEKLQEAVRIKPAYVEAHNNLGTALARTGQFPAAIEQFREALRLNPDYLLARSNLASALAQSGNAADAIEQNEAFLRAQPNSAEAHYNLGSALARAGRVQEAMPHFEEAVRLKPDYAEAHNNLGTALFMEGHLVEAAAEYEKAVQFKSDYAEARFNFGSTLLKMGHAAEAIPHLQEALRLNPDNPWGHYNLGLALTQTGRTEEAIGQYEETLRLKPDFKEAQINLDRAGAAPDDSAANKAEAQRPGAVNSESKN